MEPDRAALEATVRHLAAIDRPSASDGEREAAEWIAARLREHGCEARIEEERVHGTYWWPLGLTSALGAASGIALLRRPRSRVRRAAAVAAGAFGASAAADDVASARHWLRTRFLPKRSTWNVVAETGDRDARATVVVSAHHDAAHGGLIFHPEIPRMLDRRFPGLLESTDTSPPLMAPIVAAPGIVAVGALRGSRATVAAGTAIAAVCTAAFVDIGLRDTVPGANDNLTGVAALLEIARALEREPVAGLRVLLVSTGSEESLLEGMRAFGRRHFPSLAREDTTFLVLDTLGSPELIQLEGEGMLTMRSYDKALRRLLSEVAADARVYLRRGMRLRNATDGLVPLRAGYRAVTVCSMDELKQPANYHNPADVPDNVVWETVVDATTLAVAFVRRLAAQADAGDGTARTAADAAAG